MPVSTEAPEYIALEIEDAVKQIHFVLFLQDYALLEDDLMCLIEIMLFSTLPEAVVGNLIALVMKFGDRTHIGATHLATSMVAMLQLLAASFVWMWHVNISQLAMNGETMSTIVSLSGGALVANLISVVLLIGETLRQTR